MCGEKGESVTHLTSSASWPNINIKGDTTTSRGMCTSNFVERQNLNGQRSGTNTPQSEW